MNYVCSGWLCSGKRERNVAGKTTYVMDECVVGGRESLLV
jgi:hypothetical protein